ncbi:zf-PARP-domain-containing protein [Aspergillus sclerotiicarbonarius CBS 121057]|uniref:Zf-PARP-domain-containing protein n=1 Tax=Aspergillus sclerotiicarbonarius (strain CBS 121057 / IBT 28362) TaxID=1448318 RepID=A0A319E208_ASPSB|nr:zf-PARP-domain-containing protein [Aspergillus sclerotiicarbonarius CBS 121057]
MGAYRLEEASTGRAGCKNKECKDQGIKIAKGELRHGSWVDTERFQSYAWRHWGCVTPKIVANMIEAVGDANESGERDYTALDGYEELPQEAQAKVRKALEQGHVDDEDWKGDVELNRPGKTGFRKRASKKATDETPEKPTPEKTAPPSKKRARAEPKEEAGSEADGAEAKETPKPKKSASEKATPQSKKRARVEPKEEAEADGEEAKETPKPKKPRKSSTPKPAPAEEAKVNEDEGKGDSAGKAESKAEAEADGSDTPLVKTTKKGTTTKGKRAKTAASPPAEPTRARSTRVRDAAKKKEEAAASAAADGEASPAEKPKRTYKKKKTT